MAPHFKISLTIFSLVFFIGMNFSSPILTSNQEVGKYIQPNPAFSDAYHYSSENLPHNTLVQIRHRNAEKTKDVKLSPHWMRVYELISSYSPSEYFAKWSAYFHFIHYGLIIDQISPACFSLRSPPPTMLIVRSVIYFRTI